MHWIICSMAQSIPIECSGFHAASMNAEDSMHCGAMDTDCMQSSPCSEAQCIPMECSGFYAAWPKSSRLNAVDYMQHDCSSVIHGCEEIQSTAEQSGSGKVGSTP